MWKDHKNAIKTVQCGFIFILYSLWQTKILNLNDFVFAMFRLLLCALMSLDQEEFQRAEDLLDAATYISPEKSLPWTLLGMLLYTTSWIQFLEERRRRVKTMRCNCAIWCWHLHRDCYYLGLFYSGVENSIMAERSFNQAMKCTVIPQEENGVYFSTT